MYSHVSWIVDMCYNPEHLERDRCSCHFLGGPTRIRVKTPLEGRSLEGHCSSDGSHQISVGKIRQNVQQLKSHHFL